MGNNEIAGQTLTLLACMMANDDEILTEFLANVSEQLSLSKGNNENKLGFTAISDNKEIQVAFGFKISEIHNEVE